jgi:hypothetical protein
MERVTLEALSLEVVIGLLAVSVSHSPTSAALSQSQPSSILHVPSKTDDRTAIEPKRLPLSNTAIEPKRLPLSNVSMTTDEITGVHAASRTDSTISNGRTVQLWACGADPPVPPYGSGVIETSVFTHIENITAVSICGLSLGSNGSLVGITDIMQKSQLYAGEMGLPVYPLIGGNLSSLHAAMARADDFITESVEAAVELVADGYNIDLEIGTQDIQPKDTHDYLAFLNAWATALDAAGLELQYDLGGCNDPFKTDYMGLTCKLLASSKLPRLIRSVTLHCIALLLH